MTPQPNPQLVFRCSQTGLPGQVVLDVEEGDGDVIVSVEATRTKARWFSCSASLDTRGRKLSLAHLPWRRSTSLRLPHPLLSFLLKLAKHLPAWTLSALPGPSTWPFHWANRPLAVEELLRLQSMPADWVVEGGYRDQVRQVGNATPALLAEVLGRAVLASLQFAAPTNPLQLAIPRRRSVPKATPVEQLRAPYRALEGEHADHPGTGLGPKPRRRSAKGKTASASDSK